MRFCLSQQLESVHEWVMELELRLNDAEDAKMDQDTLKALARKHAVACAVYDTLEELKHWGSVEEIR